MLRTMSLRMKLWIGFGMPLSAIVLLVVVVFGVVKSAGYATEKAATAFGRAVTAKQMQQDVIQVQQWLTDISATRGQDGLDDGFDEAEAARKSFYEGVEVFRAAYKEGKNDAKAQELEAIVARFENYYGVGKKMAQAYIEGGASEGNKTMGDFDGAAKGLSDVFQPFVKENVDRGNDLAQGLVSRLHAMVSGLAVVGVIVVAVTLAGAALFIRSISRPLHKVATCLKDSSAQVALAAGEISQSSHTLADGASEQAASLEETSAATEEVTSMIRLDADNIRQANALMQEASRVIGEADGAMKRLTASMQEISAASSETQKIIKTIDEIAFQTNLLALNAAVEAARAGEAGAGFAVVADEVRNLAMRAAEAAHSTSELIEGTVRKINAGTELVQEASESFAVVSQSSGRVGNLVAEVATSAGEQAKAIGQVSGAIHRIDAVVQTQASTSEETASASEELSAQAGVMREIAGELDALIEGGGGVATGHGARLDVQRSVSVLR